MLASTFGTFKKVKLGAIATIGRARKGVKIFELGDAKFGEMVLACTILDGTVVKIKINDRFGTEYYSDDSNVETDQRTTKGKYLKNVGNCQPLTVLFSKGAKRQ